MTYKRKVFAVFSISTLLRCLYRLKYNTSKTTAMPKKVLRPQKGGKIMSTEEPVRGVPRLDHALKGWFSLATES